MADNENKQALTDEEMAAVNAGMKVVVIDDDPQEMSWWEKFLKLMFKR